MPKRHIGGWWRAWIVLSAIWLLIVLAMFVVDVRWPDIEKTRSDRVKYACTVDRLEGSIHLLDHYTAADLRVALAERKPGTEEWRPELERCVTALDTDYAGERLDRVLWQVRVMGLLAVLPPLALLGLAAALGWVIRGFRRPPNA